ncbi:alanine dehydrogenase [Granulicoccus sp. GXG6511]|uniref:alanine dehydrogenase n=1 Tax=Granulicoccus sp. GXG6511 TaxID=3381351 RepID=UPI003D7C82A1
MRIAIPTEVKNNENRVGLTPAGVAELTAAGHEVFVQSGAGQASSITDEEYATQGATLVDDPDELWGLGELVLKVKEPVGEEYHRLREDLVLFTYLHLAADRPLGDRLMEAGTTALAYETVQLDSGTLPLLYPMSEVAGCLAPQVGAYHLMRPEGGRGVLMGGVGGVGNARVLVIGGGVAGQHAANTALGMGADVTVLDTDLDKLRSIYWRHRNRIHQLASSSFAIAEQVRHADLVIGAVLIPGARTPRLVSNELVAEMKPGSVLVDIAVDQGGCFADTRPTTHDKPTFQVHGSTFYCVANMPAAVPNTSTQALTNATLPYVLRLANLGWMDALHADPALAKGLNVARGQVTHPGVAEAFGVELTEVADILLD